MHIGVKMWNLLICRSYMGASTHLTNYLVNQNNYDCVPYAIRY